MALEREPYLRWQSARSVLAKVTGKVRQLKIIGSVSAPARQRDDVVERHLRLSDRLLAKLTNPPVALINSERVYSDGGGTVAAKCLLTSDPFADLHGVSQAVILNVSQPRRLIALIRLAVALPQMLAVRIAPVFHPARLTARYVCSGTLSHHLSTAVTGFFRNQNCSLRAQSLRAKLCSTRSFFARMSALGADARAVAGHSRSFANRTGAERFRIVAHRVPSGVMRLGVCTVGAALILLHSAPVAADHNTYLPLAGQTWMAQQIKATQEQVWCADARATAYPSFITQIRTVNDQYTARAGIKHRQVDFNDPSCQIRHTMPDQHGCSGCAAWIFYANKPVVIEYKYQLAYVSWESTIGHELGHGILGQLHERYIDSGGSIQCGGPERGLVVMDCGPPYVRYPTTLDVSRGCAIIVTAWCRQAPAQTFPFWNGSRWVFEDGWSFVPNSGCGEWYMPDGRLAWGACASWGGRWNDLVQIWTMPTSTYHPASNTWWSGGLALP